MVSGFNFYDLIILILIILVLTSDFIPFNENFLNFIHVLAEILPK